MIIEILCIGNELLSGITLNSNAHWLAGEIAGVGGTVKRITVVSDDLAEISTAVKESLARRPVILITTGGLGATYDDLTLEGVAIVLGKKTMLDERAVEMLKKSYAARKLDYELTEARLKMAKIPEGSTPMQNLLGSAPGVFVQAGGTRIFCLQGVPPEMKAIFEKHIMPMIKEGVGRFVAQEINYSVKGVTEAMIAPALARIVGSHPHDAIYLKTHPRGYYRKKTPQIRIQLISRGSDRKEVKKRLGAIAKVIEKEVAALGGRIC
ncbi:MAG TPA: molybdopterin-binding protein [Nitrososphaera sp.]|nr:molybdopterin-binding protein [Nitrososphaera sp.]